MNPDHHIGSATSSCIMNLDVSKFIKGSRSTPRRQQQRRRVRPSQRLGYFSSLWLSFSLSFWIFLAIAGLEFWVFYWVCWGFCCLGLLRFLFFFLFFGNFFAGCTECLGFLLKFLGDGFVARTLYVCVIEIHFLCYWNSECVYGGVCFSLF